MSSSIEVKPARTYKYVDDVWIIASYFNFNSYESKQQNLSVFLKSLDQSGLNYLLVECAFKAEPFVLPRSLHTIHVRCHSVMWQKERLLNLAISRLPKSCTKVVWLDADILFQNPDWVKETSRLLDKHPVVQPYEKVIRLFRGTQNYTGKGDAYVSFASVLALRPGFFLSGNFDAHGHTGFAWAARRELLEKYSLYDYSISGGGDHLMAHGFCGDRSSPCVQRMVGRNTPYADSFSRWTKRVYGAVESDIGCVPGTILHLWHGQWVNRRYSERARELLKLNYDPSKDLRLGRNNVWEWTNKNRPLQAWASEYFTLRKEDICEDDKK